LSRRFSIDTSILIEYIVKSAPYRSKVAELLENPARGKFELYLNPITLSETLYVASRIYEIAGDENPNESALDFIRWLKKRIKIVDVDEVISLRAG